MKTINLKSIIFLLVIIIAISACSKEKTVVDKLAGDWEYNSYTDINNNKIHTIPLTTLHFDNCDTKYTNCGYSVSGLGSTTYSEYNLSNNLDTIIYYKIGSTIPKGKSYIKKLTKNRLEIRNEYNGEIVEIILNKKN